VLLVGAGEMIALVAAHFAKSAAQAHDGGQPHAERGEALAQRLGGHTMPWPNCPARLHEFDVVVSCTASTCRSSAWAPWSAR
jgi:glutamyl-tRNA reductase